MSDKESNNLPSYSFIIGSLGSALLLFHHQQYPLAKNVIGFGGWIAEKFGFTGFLPSLGAASLVGGFLLTVLTLFITPQIEEWFAKKSADRGSKTLAQPKKLSVENEMKKLVKKFGK